MEEFHARYATTRRLLCAAFQMVAQVLTNDGGRSALQVSATKYSHNKPSKNANVAPRTVLNAAIKPLYVYAGKNARHSVMENKDARWIPSVNCIGCECFDCDNRTLLAVQWRGANANEAALSARVHRLW